jgi:zinc transport system ATP-binding protein
MQVNTISVKNLFVSYQSSRILNDITFDVAKGDYIGVVGPNGAGKTTLIKAILGLVRSKNGCIEIFGQAQANFKLWQKIGYLPQKPLSLNAMFPSTVREIVSLGLLSKKKFPKRLDHFDEEAIDKALDAMEISSLKDELVGELSGGQQQRVLAARAIVNEPELLILDEPVTALDPESSSKFMATIQRLNKENGVTILLVTHDMADIGKFASKLLYVDRKLIFYGTFREVCLAESVTAYFGEYLQHLMCHQHDKKETH